MYFDSLAEIPKIVSRYGTTILVVPNETPVELKNALVLEPVEKSTITIDQAREIMPRLTLKQKSDLYIIIRPAEKLGEEAANALLKSLEEPGEKVHFVLVTEQPAALLPTILSRAAMFCFKSHEPVDGDIQAEEKVRNHAKQLITARGADLVKVAEDITKKKEGVKAYALTVLATAIEMLYKSYFKTNKTVFVAKIPKFLQAYEAISKNGQVKLHLVADLL